MVPDASFPGWFTALSLGSLIVGAICALIIALDEIGRPQRMWIMNIVWPVTALFGSLLWLAGYFAWGRQAPRARQQEMKARKEEPPKPPFPVMVAKGASHCGAGCTLGDIVAETLALAVPGIAVALGWKSLFAEKTFAVWILDYAVAFLIGVAFQYFTIKPMRQLSPADGLKQALKADFFSITAWQVGMYGFMAFGQFVWLRTAFGGKAPVASPEFWFIMQIAMICGFVTAYPVNWVLLKMGVKEKM